MVTAECRGMVPPTRPLQICRRVKQAELVLPPHAAASNPDLHRLGSKQNIYPRLGELYGLRSVPVTRDPAEVLPPALSW